MPASATTHHPARARTARRGVALAVALSWLIAAAAPSAAVAQAAPGAGGKAPPPAVTVVVLEEQDVTLTARMPGRIVASRVAEVRPQVSGLIVDRMFNTGTHVEPGDPLYQIDSASYEAAVNLAEAQVAEAKARLTAAEKAARRARELIERHVVSESKLDQAVAERDSAAAALRVAQAQLRLAQIDLNHTTIRAPIAGIIGRSLTTVGALVTKGQANPLAVIRRLEPVLVDVTQSAAEITDWRRKQKTKKLAETDPTVTLILADGEPYPHKGHLAAAEPHVDEQTGVVTLRMEFPNPDHLLLPGMYAKAAMPQGVAENAILAPMEGVSRDRRGRPTALVVNDDNVVERRNLKVIGSRGSAWIVTDGLKAGDRLIVEGLQKARPGMTVAPERRSASGPAGPAFEGSRQAASAEP